MTKFRKGSAGAAQQKYNNRFLIGAVLLHLFVIALLFWIPNDLRKLAAEANGWLKALGVILIAVSCGMWFYGLKITRITFGYVIGSIVALGAGIGTACGWNF